MHCGDIDFLIGLACAHAPCQLWREIEERSQRPAGLFTRPEFQHLAEQHEHGDDGGRLVVEVDATMGVAEAQGKRPGASVATRL